MKSGRNSTTEKSATLPFRGDSQKLPMSCYGNNRLGDRGVIAPFPTQTGLSCTTRSAGSLMKAGGIGQNHSHAHPQ
jgi:hypothetical protein